MPLMRHLLAIVVLFGVTDAIAGAVYETVVEGRKPRGKDASGDVTVVDGQTLRDSPRASTLEAVAQESGDVYVTGRGLLHGIAAGASGGITIRGLGGSPNTQVLVVEDGVPDVQGIFGHPIPDAYVPLLIDRVLVIKGGDSVLYGSNALGGALLIENRWRKSAGVELVSDSAAGSYATLRQTLALLGRWGSWDVTAGVSALNSDGHREGAGGAMQVLHLAGRYRVSDRASLALRNKTVHLAGADPGPVTHPHEGHTFDVWRTNSSLQLAMAQGALKLALTPYVNVGIHRLYDGFYALDYLAGGTLEAELALHRAWTLLLGAASNAVGGDVENRISATAQNVSGMVDMSLYQQATVRPFPALALVAGLRQFFSDTYGFALLYKAGARWQVTDALYAHTRLAYNFRQPTLRELYLPFPVANPDLKPEFALNGDVGLGYQTAWFEANATVYRTAARQLIRYFGAWPSAEVVNIDRHTFWGIEGTLALKGLGPFSLRVAGDWRDVGRYSRQNPSAKVNATLTAQHGWSNQVVSGSLSSEWVSGLYMANYQRDPLDDVFVIDLVFRYRTVTAQRGVFFEPYVIARNILDRRYAYVAGYPMPGFNVLAGLRLGV